MCRYLAAVHAAAQEASREKFKGVGAAISPAAAAAGYAAAVAEASAANSPIPVAANRPVSDQ